MVMDVGSPHSCILAVESPRLRSTSPRRQRCPGAGKLHGETPRVSGLSADLCAADFYKQQQTKSNSVVRPAAHTACCTVAGQAAALERLKLVYRARPTSVAGECE